jgi:hypothetical protein
MLGSMQFSAIHLQPLDISLSSSRRAVQSSDIGKILSGDLILWGITYGVLADLLDMLPPFDFVESFHYPFFKSWDYRLMVWILSREYRRDRMQELMEFKWSDMIGGRRESGKRSDETEKIRPGAIEHLIEMYFPFVKKAVYLVIVFRTLVILCPIIFICIKYF